MNIDIKKLNFAKMNGLLPAVIQDFETLEVLMVGFMNEEALNETLKSGKVTFYSRSKNRLWQKGETSGNFLELINLKIDCDSDTLLIYARSLGPTCHTGTNSCFGEGVFGITQLYRLINKRKRTLPEKSYTASLFREGLEKILAKVEEESAEVLQAARVEGRQRMVEESCDLIYHLFVLLNQQDISLEEVNEEFRKRNKE